MTSFEAAENALVDKLRTLDFLDEGNCRAGETDACFRYAMSSGTKYVCVTDYAGGRNAGRRLWAHSISVMFAIRVEGEVEVEEDVRMVVDSLFDLILPENDLDGVANASIDAAQAPIPASRNDVPFVYLFFTVEAVQRMARTC